MRLLVILAICAVAACSLYEGSTSIARSPLPDAGNHSCGDSGSNYYPDAGPYYPDGGYWIDDAPNNNDGGSYYPDAYLPPADAGHAHP
jgi:hypothetical protein